MEGRKQYIFIDNGYDTMKCAQLSTNIYHDFDYFCLPTILIPHFTDMQFTKSKIDMALEKHIKTRYRSHFNEQTEKRMPIQKGVITGEGLLQYPVVWKKVIDQFLSPQEARKGVDAESSTSLNLLMSEPSVNLEERIEQRATLTQIAFEQLNCETFALVPQSSLQLFATLRHSGLVVDFGAGLTQISPVLNGYTSFNASTSFKVCGNIVDKFILHTIMQSNKKQIPTSDIPQYVIKRDLKEQYYQEDDYTLPDGTKIQVSKNQGYDRDAYAYLYFDSSLVREVEDYWKGRQPIDREPLTGKWATNKLSHEQTKQSVALYDADGLIDRKSIVHKTLQTLINFTINENIPKKSIETIFLTGGALQLGNLGNIIQTQLENKCINDFPNLQVIQQKDPQNFIIQGARVYCSMQHLDQILITRDEYYEEGASRVNKKCY